MGNKKNLIGPCIALLMILFGLSLIIFTDRYCCLVLYCVDHMRHDIYLKLGLFYFMLGSVFGWMLHWLHVNHSRHFL